MTKKGMFPVSSADSSRKIYSPEDEIKDIDKKPIADFELNMYMYFNFEQLGHCSNKSAHSCFCKMETQELKKLGSFFQKFYHCREDNFYSRFKQNPSNLKLNGDKKQVIHLYVDNKFRLHGYRENNIFYVVALDPNHRDSKN